MATIFPREEKAEALFGEILKNPEACHRLMDTFNDSLDMADVLDAPEISAQQFTTALFNAYANKDLSAFLMAICQHSMFDLLRNAALIPFKFNADGEPNPVILTDDAGVLLPGLPSAPGNTTGSSGCSKSRQKSKCTLPPAIASITAMMRIPWMWWSTTTTSTLVCS